MDADSSLHVVIFPWLAFGHLLPCLELSERLAARGHRVSFVSTPRNIRRLPPVAPALAALVELVALPLPLVDGLPEGAESTSDVPFDMFGLHRKAFDGLAVPFAAFLDECAEKPDWVIADFMHHWVAAAAVDRKVPCVFLLLGAAALPASAASLSSEAESIQKEYNRVDASGISITQRFLLTLERSKLVAVRSCVHFEPEPLAMLPELFKKPVVPLGLLPPPPDGARGAAGEHDGSIMRWLGEQPAESVVYVALGSEAPLSVELVRELALGLELAGTRFLWALRRPTGVTGDGSAQGVLPEGFEERTRGRGLVATGWVPQVRILAHEAVGGFLTHCGWNSIIESLQFGRPLIMLPIYGDQGPNARLMEARKVGVRIARDEKDGSFDRDGVARAVRAVMVEEEGRVFAGNAKELQKIVADRKCHEKCIDDFVAHLRTYKED